MSDDQMQHYNAVKAKKWKRFSVSIHMVPQILLEYHVLKVATPKTRW